MISEEILSKSEKFVLRWGLALSALLLFLLLVIARFIKYPRDISIEGKVIFNETEINKQKLTFSQNDSLIPATLYVFFIVKKSISTEIHINQFLKIKFKEYPVADFGFTQGIVSNIVCYSEMDSCKVLISLPRKVITTKEKKITLDESLIPKVVIEDKNSNLLEEISEFIF